MIRWITRIIIVLMLGATVFAASAWYRGNADKPSGFRTVQVKRSDIASTISATGTLEPEEVIDIGAGRRPDHRLRHRHQGQGGRLRLAGDGGHGAGSH